MHYLSNAILILHFTEPGIPYFTKVSAGTTGGIGEERKSIYFTRELGQ